jgi:beta-glucosidase/6-phospho-beta-glucosidase/beta-galactosidase
MNVKYGADLVTTFNEPLLYSSNGKSIDTVVKAHAVLYHFYHDEIKGTRKFGIKFNDNFSVPLDPNNSSDVDMANHFNEFQLAIFGNPIFLGIDYSEAYKMTIPDYFRLTAEDLANIGNTSDLFLWR